MTDAITLHRTHRMSKQTMLAHLTGVFSIAAGTIPDTVLTRYALNRILGKQLRNRIADGVIRSVADNQDYAVIYYRCFPRECFAAEFVELSYRASSLGNFVLVRPAVVSGNLGTVHNTPRNTGGN